MYVDVKSLDPAFLESVCLSLLTILRKKKLELELEKAYLSDTIRGPLTYTRA